MVALTHEQLASEVAFWVAVWATVLAACYIVSDMFFPSFAKLDSGVAGKKTDEKVGVVSFLGVVRHKCKKRTRSFAQLQAHHLLVDSHGAPKLIISVFLESDPP
jgi:hypothetical protein